MRLAPALLTGVLCLTLCRSAFAAKTLIDFEAQGAGAPQYFDGKIDSPLNIGIATFTGGELLNLKPDAFYWADPTIVYATADLYYTCLYGPSCPYSNPVTISFARPVSQFSLSVIDGYTDSITVSDNVGDSQTAVIAEDSGKTFYLAGTDISSVSVSAYAGWNFELDNVRFTANSAVPEPSALALSAAGVLLVIAGFGKALRFPGSANAPNG